MLDVEFGITIIRQEADGGYGYYNFGTKSADQSRCRTYQLYVMLEKIFDYLLPSMSVFQKENFSSLFRLIDNSIQMFYTPSELLINASDYEMHILQALITPKICSTYLDFI